MNEWTNEQNLHITGGICCKGRQLSSLKAEWMNECYTLPASVLARKQLSSFLWLNEWMKEWTLRITLSCYCQTRQLSAITSWTEWMNEWMLRITSASHCQGSNYPPFKVNQRDKNTTLMIVVTGNQTSCPPFKATFPSNLCIRPIPCSLILSDTTRQVEMKPPLCGTLS